MRKEAIILGGGPAGIGAAIWLKKLGVEAVLLERAGALGGLQRRSPYENLWIPGVEGKTGQDVARALADHATTVGVEVQLNHSAPVTYDTLYHCGEFSAPFVVIATGTTPRAGRFTASPTVAIGPGEPMEALDVAGRRVAILGGGDNAFDQARFARDRGGQVTVFSRGEPRAQKALRDLVPDVRVVVGPYDAHQAAMTIDDEAFDVLGVMYGFEAVVPEGLKPRRRGGYIQVNRKAETSLSGVYACGEVTDYWHPCVTTAAAHGIQAAKQIAGKLGK